MIRRCLVIAALGANLGLLVGCGGSQPETKTAASAEVEVPPMNQLKAISTDLQAEVAALTKPIDDAQSFFDELSGLPKKYGFDMADMTAMAKGTLDTGKIEVKADLNLTTEAQAEVQLLLKKLNDIVVGIKATPDRVVSLTKKLAADTAMVPVLATRVTASASFATANPFAGADVRAKAKADTAELAQVEKDVNKTISDTQAKIVGIPTMASAALAKLVASLSAGVSAG